MKEEFRSGARPVRMWKHNKSEALGFFVGQIRQKHFEKEIIQLGTSVIVLHRHTVSYMHAR